MATAAPQRYESMDEGEFEVFENLPVFDEHEGDDGVVYDKNLLQRIADNNNHRIEDTGDWCPIVAGHTPDADHPGEQPDIIGWAGPFKVSVLGNVEPRHCIFADFRIHKEHAERFRKNPRRSVELWPEDDPKERFFDPIAVLGAETPKRPLGIAYSRPKHGKRPIRYQMDAAPATEAGGHNTFIPSGIKKKKPHSYNLEDFNNMDAVSPELLAQIVEALAPLIGAQIDERMNVLHANEPGGMEEPDTPPADAPPEMPPSPMPQATGLPPEGTIGPDAPLAPPEEPMPAGPGPDMVPPEEAPPVEPAAEEDEEKKKRDRFQQYAHGRMVQYMMEDDGEHKTGAMEKCMKFAQGLDEEDRGHMGAVMEGGDDDEQKAFYRRMRYAMEDDGEEMHEGDDKEKYAKARASRDEYRERYRKADAERNELAQKCAKFQAEAETSKTKERYAKRRGALDALAHEGFVLDTDAEMKDCDAFSDEQFEQHQDRIRQRYAKAGKVGVAQFAVTPDTTPPDTKADEYSSKAVAIVSKYRREGKDVAFKSVMDNLFANNGEYVETVEA